MTIFSLLIARGVITMKTLAIPMCALAGLIAAAPAVARSSDGRPFASPNQCRRDTIPAHTHYVTKTILLPAERELRQVPRYETTTVKLVESAQDNGDGTLRVQLGARTERRIIGFTSEWVITVGAREREVTELIQIPREHVTVIPDGMRIDAPLRGTTRVLTATAFAELVSPLRGASLVE